MYSTECGFPDSEFSLFFWILRKSEDLVFNCALIQLLDRASGLYTRLVLKNHTKYNKSGHQFYIMYVYFFLFYLNSWNFVSCHVLNSWNRTKWIHKIWTSCCDSWRQSPSPVGARRSCWAVLRLAAWLLVPISSSVDRDWCSLPSLTLTLNSWNLWGTIPFCSKVLLQPPVKCRMLLFPFILRWRGEFLLRAELTS